MTKFAVTAELFGFLFNFFHFHHHFFKMVELFRKIMGNVPLYQEFRYWLHYFILLTFTEENLMSLKLIIWYTNLQCRAYDMKKVYTKNHIHIYIVTGWGVTRQGLLNKCPRGWVYSQYGSANKNGGTSTRGCSGGVHALFLLSWCSEWVCAVLCCAVLCCAVLCSSGAGRSHAAVCGRDQRAS